MTTTRQLGCDDLFRFAPTNLDLLTATYDPGFYWTYLSRWPGMCTVQESTSGRISSYMIGKAEGIGKEWRGHISAVTVAPEFRRLGLAGTLMKELERVSDKMYNGYFVDLFVREDNKPAIKMYQQLGYSVYRRVLGYYRGSTNGAQDAFDMRKALPRDVNKQSIIPLPKPVHPYDIAD